MMARAVKSIKFTHSGDADTLEQIIEVPDGGPVGYWELWGRRTNGTGTAHIESVYGAFEKSAENSYQLGYSYSNFEDQLAYFNSSDNMFPYLKVEVDFANDDESTEVELYLICL